ncbi:hypothetical protein D5R81_18025 [Parashewanella spongiae]|uniref:ISAs1 family transposase n=1 Tax=Parashewanella spongiae TaxID=342950 RepID=A0A3A6T9X7_9GAMM|nr:hypothetical protein D5R81_18025 [Parashewanella spongiae]
MSREAHVPFYEGLLGRFQRSTLLSFDEDSCRLRSGNAAENMAIMNKTALNMLKNEKTAKVGIKSKRLKAGWDEEYLMKVLTVGKLAV